MSSLPHKDRVTTLKLTAEQARAIEARAKKCGVSRAVWMRTVLLQAASLKPIDGFIRIKEPDGTLI
jgi:hypothetical protein